VPRITVIIHDFSQEPPQLPARRQQLRKVRGHSMQKKHGRGQHELESRTWLDLAERVLYSWPITLRVAALLAILLTGTAAVAAALGVGGQLLLAALALRTRLNSRRRTAVLRQRRAALEAADR
jgi:hypothetical protein